MKILVYVDIWLRTAALPAYWLHQEQKAHMQEITERQESLAFGQKRNRKEPGTLKRSTVFTTVMKYGLEAVENPTASHEAVSRWSREEGDVEKGPGPELPEGGG